MYCSKMKKIYLLLDLELGAKRKADSPEPSMVGPIESFFHFMLFNFFKINAVNKII